MQLYSCKLRLNSNAMHEVMKVVTVPEIIVLRVVHSIGEAPGGNLPVDDIKPLPGRFRMVRDFPGDAERTTDHKSTDAEELAWLERTYGGALRKSKSTPTLSSIFGVGQPLPKTTDGVPDVIDPATVKRTVVLQKKTGTDGLGELA